MTRAEAIREEDRRCRRVRRIATTVTSLLSQGNLTRQEGEAVIALARSEILALFPGREDTYELLYGRRFQRVLEECTAPPSGRGGRGPATVLPFPSSPRPLSQKP